MGTENWKPVVGDGGWYEVRDRGRVKSLHTKKPGGGNWVKNRVLVQQTNNNHGYLHVCLWDGKKRRTRTVHRLIAEAFLGPCPASCEVNHRNGDKRDNNAANLEYVTKAGNLLHTRL